MDDAHEEIKDDRYLSKAHMKFFGNKLSDLCEYKKGMTRKEILEHLKELTVIVES